MGSACAIEVASASRSESINHLHIATVLRLR
jgi:hypothetical protein